MITTHEATQIVMSHLLVLETEKVPLEKAVGKVLQETLLADRDFPPFDRVSMDGIAYDMADVKEHNVLVVDDVQLAGAAQKTLKASGRCLEVMTGAMLPANTNTVTRYEDVEFFEEQGRKKARLLVMPQKERQNIHTQGLDQQAGDILLEAGSLLNPAGIAVAAAVGKTHLTVSKAPSFGIISTGDELVDVQATPEPYQIRKSNIYALQAALQQMDMPSVLYHFEDTQEALREGLSKALEQHQVLILSGGVSKGKADYVPQVLEELGVQKLFHRVQQRPGKPFWFGHTAEGKVVFALPGNPVSTFMCFHRYVKPWLMRSMGLPAQHYSTAVLAEDVTFDPPLTYFLQVRAKNNEQGVLTAYPYHGHGSGDFANLLLCNGFLELPADRQSFKKGDKFPLILFDKLL